LPFESVFYTKLNNITYQNIRNIEKIFGLILRYEIEREEPSFNNDFYTSFIKLMSDSEYDDILVDLVLDKTVGKKR